MVVKTYRGMLADSGQDRIRLSTIKGKVGYRIVKFELIGNLPGAQTQECVVKIYTDEQSSVDAVIDFTKSGLLAAGIYHNNAAAIYPATLITIFDQVVFNQDIYITARDTDSAQATNYYIELEVTALDDASAEYTTLKDMRQT